LGFGNSVNILSYHAALPNIFLHILFAFSEIMRCFFYIIFFLRIPFSYFPAVKIKNIPTENF
jgi:hypothetical protein